MMGYPTVNDNLGYSKVNLGEPVSPAMAGTLLSKA
jgi:hypothetical protein